MLSIKDLSVTYSNGTHALEKADASLPESSITGIIGPNGGGKSSFLKGILGLVPHKGQALFKGQALDKFAKNTAYVEQKGNLDMDFPISVEQCVLLGTYPKLGLLKRPGKREKALAGEALSRVGLSAYKNRQIGELSGGQFQRVLIARTLAQEAELILLDEPFVGIDVQSEKIIVSLLQELAKEGATILVVHHDLSKVKNYFDHLILINKTVIAVGPTEIVYNKENLQKTFDLPAVTLLPSS